MCVVTLLHSCAPLIGRERVKMQIFERVVFVVVFCGGSGCMVLLVAGLVVAVVLVDVCIVIVVVTAQWFRGRKRR